MSGTIISAFVRQAVLPALDVGHMIHQLLLRKLGLSIAAINIAGESVAVHGAWGCISQRYCVLRASMSGGAEA